MEQKDDINLVFFYTLEIFVYNKRENFLFYKKEGRYL